MAKQGRKSKSKSVLTSFLFFVAVVAVILGRFNSSFETARETTDTVTKANSSVAAVHFIDVGQGSSTLIQSGSLGILIDAGEKEYGEDVLKYLRSNGISELEYVVATHPHTDHIGGLLTILENFKVKNIIMPKLTAQNTPTTKTYEKLLETIAQKKIKAIAASYGKEYSAGEISLKILGPVEQNKDLNNMSVICRAVVRTTSVMLVGDAETPEMKSVLSYEPDLSCDIMLMGHHGSRTSLQKSFLKQVAPNLAIISCGKDNSYGHPHEETLKYLKNNKIEFCRTDLNGTVVVKCFDDGYRIIKTK